MNSDKIGARMAPTQHAHFSSSAVVTSPLRKIHVDLGVFPTKTVKVRKIHSYNDLRKLAKPHSLVHHHLLLIQLNWPTAKLAQVLSLVFTRNDSFPLRA